MPVSTIDDWTAAMMTSLTGAMAMFFSAIPRVLGFVLILVIGWFVASLIGKLISALLHAVQFNSLAQRAGFTDFVKKMGVQTDASNFIAELGKWFIRLMRQLLLWLPNFVVAMVVLILGGLVAKAASSLVRGCRGSEERGPSLGRRPKNTISVGTNGSLKATMSSRKIRSCRCEKICEAGALDVHWLSAFSDTK